MTESRTLPFDLFLSDIKEVEVGRYQEIITALEETWADLKLDGKALGLAAPQIGLPFKVAIIRLPGKSYAIVNPRILRRSNSYIVPQEACLSLEQAYATRRYRRIRIIDEIDGERTIRDQREALVLQHEVDHLNGITIYDRRRRR